MKSKNKGIEKIATEQQIILKADFAIAVRNFLSHLYDVLKMVWRDLKSPVVLPWRHTIRAWRCGFRRFNYSIYGLVQSGNPNDYLSDYKSLRVKRINNRFGELVNNKLAFPLMMKHHGMPTPEIKGIIRKGIFYPLSPGKTLESSRLLIELCKPGERLVIKPVFGSHGFGFMMVARSNDGYRINGEDISLHTLTEIISKLDNYVVTEFAEQGEYGARLFPDTTNTIRVVTFWDVEKVKPFIARVVQRIGTSRSYPVDNFKAGHGGLSALIEPENGEMGPGAMVSAKGHVTWYAEHPETHATIKGGVVPEWIEIRRSILEYASRFAFAPCIAWDILPTRSGFTIIEGNSTTGMAVLQVHGPILTDPRITRFYKHHGVIA